MRTRCRVPIAAQPLLAVQEEAEEEKAEEVTDCMWEEHSQAMRSEMSKQELEEEVKWKEG